MLTPILFFLASAVAIYLACEYFVNAIEWCGHRLQLGAVAVGSLLAAFGTALPESTVTFMAVVFGRSEAERQLGIGAALGGPLVLSTVAYAIVGIAMLFLGFRTAPVALPQPSLIRRDQSLFLALFAASLVLGLTDLPGKRWFALGFVAAYLLYARSRVHNAGAVAEEEELEPLKFRPANPTLGWAALQATLALTVITVASRVFVAQLGTMAAALHCPPQLAALLLSPVATELPETVNALIWVRQGRIRLALANISGSMMIQATIPAALGLFFTGWRFDRPLILSAAITLLAIAFLCWTLSARIVRPRALALAAVFYLLFGVAIGYDFAHRWQHVPAADHARPNPYAATPEVLSAGRALFAANCAGCHRSGGPGPALTRNKLGQPTDGDLEWFLRQGDLGQGMPSWRSLPEPDRWRVIRYLRTLP
jgi:cation:H+ antiporter